MKVIIVPTDFSDNAANAVKYAIQLSKMHYYKLVFVHVYSLPFLNPEAGMVYDASFSEAMKIQSDKALREHIDKVFESLGMHRNLLLSELETVEAISLSGGIEKINHKYHGDWIVMGTHGASGLKKFFLGSNAVDVIENVNIPVLSVPSNLEFKQIKNVSYASDYNDIDGELKLVIDFAKSFNAQVDVIHIATDNNLNNNLEVDQLIKKWQSVNQYQKINLHVMQNADKTNVDETLKTLMSQIDIDLLIVFHQHRNFWKTIFEKSVTTELVYDWSSPILTMYKK